MKIGAIGIRTKIIVGDAATWYLVKKYIDGKIIDLATDYETLNDKPKINDVELSGNKTSEDLGLVSAVEGKSLVDDLEIEKLAGIEENANNYTHPDTHPSSILDVVDAVNGAANKFFNERGEMVAVAHEALTVQNSEAAVQHVDTTTTKETLDEADKVALWDSETGKVVLTPKAQFAMTEQEEWITPTLLNGWVNGVSGLEYMKDEFGFVHVRGQVKGGTSSIIFYFPSGYRPKANAYFSIISATVPHGLYVSSSGAVVLTAGYSNIWISIDAITFKAKN